MTNYFAVDGSIKRVNFYQNTLHNDNIEAGFGSNVDFRIKHDGTDTTLSNFEGDLIITQNADDKDIIFKSDNGSGGTTTYFRLDGSAGVYTNFPDNSTLSFGSDHDLRIAHDGTTASIFNTVGNLQIINYADDKDILFRSDDGSGDIETYFFLDGSGNSGNIPRTVFPDNSNLVFGTGNDLFISHNGSSSSINNYTGNLFITQQADDADLKLRCDDGSAWIVTGKQKLN